MLTGIFPANASPFVIPICRSSQTGNSNFFSSLTSLRVLLMPVPAHATA